MIQPIPQSESDRATEGHDNPLLEGIFLASSAEELFPLLARNPFRDRAWLRRNQDIDLFPAYMKAVLAPTNSALTTGLALHKALKISLHQRNPRLQQNQRDYFSNTTTSKSEAYLHPCHAGLVLSGLTGVGKSHQLEAGLRTIPQVIRRFDLPGIKQVDQITWLRLDMSTIASIEALAEQLVEQIDTLLGANGEISDQAFRGARGAGTKMSRALRRLKTYFVGIVAVDEIQPDNFARLGAANLRDWFLRIANQRIALAFSGNPLGFRLNLPMKATAEEKLSTQLMRRLFATNEVRLDPAEAIDDPDWKIFTRTIAHCHLDGSIEPYDEVCESLKLTLSGGFEDFYVELHCQIEQIRHSNPNRKIDEGLITEAAAASTKLKRMRTLIRAFADRDSVKLRQCIDVDHQYYSAKWIGASIAPPPTGNNDPVTLVANDSFSSDPKKAIDQDRKAIENASRKREEKEKPATSPIAQSVIEHHLSELDAMIEGTKKHGDK